VAYRLLMLAGFVIMCAVWVLTVLLSGMKRYQAIVLLFGGSYALIVVLSLLLRPLGLEGCWRLRLRQPGLLAGMWLLTVHDFAGPGPSCASISCARNWPTRR
jgi:uncharacterized membrane protein